MTKLVAVDRELPTYSMAEPRMILPRSIRCLAHSSCYYCQTRPHKYLLACGKMFFEVSNLFFCFTNFYTYFLPIKRVCTPSQLCQLLSQLL
jgi:hypothetical protein